MVLQGLTNHAVETVTIRTLTSENTVPLGTDLDPRNAYNNLWAADKVRDPLDKIQVSCNSSCRILDGENIGYSFGQEVLGKPNMWDCEGLRRAARFFQCQGIHVIIVSKRRNAKENLPTDGVDVVIAERTDDVMLLKQAYQRNCPIVSQGSFSNWSLLVPRAEL